MRLAGLIATALAAGMPAAAIAQPAPPLTLAPGEVLLEIDATGTAYSRPDFARVYAAAVSRGETSASARALNSALLDRLKSAARASGVAESDVRRSTGPSARMGFVGNEAVGWTVAPPGSPPAEKTESAFLEIRLRDPSRFEALRAALEEAGADQVGGPVYALEDEADARRTAKADAVRQARREADEYARALGLRVARLLRVSERTGGYVDPAELETMMSAISGISGSASDQIETKARISADFALAPPRRP